ncbi:MarR family winged helix-turn-helix transcriptional regulator [Cellulomonas aerilata]|uniref:MarR family transcriptional regulator n=1 Tax=Cellulomonas aerilata TaxID=515326 RepID=A0A512DBB3_9CELL|nr:MarR family winged helix-turn-helix transcriptional regulator [Cellulomonas aerilata]GEO33745.1 MarR family transcriptional regulator [Cellulomonas aerilata]
MPLDPSTWPTGRLLSSAARRIEREFNAHLDAWDLNHASLPVLVHLAVQDHSQRELAAATGVTEQTMSRLLARIERLGYVTRKPHAEDRRRHVIALTEQGARVLREAADRERSEAMVARGLTAEEMRELRRLLTALVAAHPDPSDDDPAHPPRHR